MRRNKVEIVLSGFEYQVYRKLAEQRNMTIERYIGLIHTKYCEKCLKEEVLF